MKKRISKVLAGAGVASRRACEEMILDKRISVNGELITEPFTLVDPTKDQVFVDKKLISLAPEKKVYFVLNKPEGYLCTSKRTFANSKLAIDLLAHLPYRLFTVGRLDKETTGLLLITNDGHFSQFAIHPSFNITKEYLAKTSQEITFEHLKQISDGMWVEGTFVKPVLVKKVRRGTLKITLSEGKKREVRRLLEKAGLEVRELCRIRLGCINLGNLPLGEYRELTFDELNYFLNRKMASQTTT